MSDYRGTVQRLGEYMRAGVPLVIVRTAERHRVQDAVREVAAGIGARAFCYTDSRQVESLSAEAGAPLDVDSDPLGHVTETFLRGRHQTFLLCDTRRLNDDTLYTRELLSVANLARDTGNTLVVVAAEDVWPRLAALGLFIDLQQPSFDERLALIHEFAASFADRVAFSSQGAIRLGTLMRGLSEVQVTNLLRAALVRYGSLGDDHVPCIAAHKDRLFARVANITPIDVPVDLHVAGLEHLKAWLEEKHDVFYAPDELLARYRLDAPKGILLMGVPGCGKSFSARMVAARWGLPLYRFDLGAIYDKYVGESERRMREALDYIDNIAPCVLWVDEIEKALGANGGDSDVANRVLGQFLFWLQESTARVFLVATANNVDRLPPELFRKGRFSERFFIDLPHDGERQAAIALYAQQSLGAVLDDATMTQLVAASDGFSYADIEHAVKDVAEALAFQRLAKSVPEALADAFASTVPTPAEQLRAIRAWGVTNAVPASAASSDSVATYAIDHEGSKR